MALKQRDAAVAIGLVGLVAAWWWNKRNAGALASIAARLPGAPSSVLPSRQVGTGYVDPIWGGTGLSGVLPSAQVGRGYLDPITGGTGLPGVRVDPSTGDVSAPYGTDLMLPVVDPYDPALAQMPNVSPVNGDLIDAARADMAVIDTTDAVSVDDAGNVYDANGNLIEAGWSV
jgi:hypothetical protein